MQTAFFCDNLLSQGNLHPTWRIKIWDQISSLQNSSVLGPFYSKEIVLDGRASSCVAGTTLCYISLLSGCWNIDDDLVGQLTTLLSKVMLPKGLLPKGMLHKGMLPKGLVPRGMLPKGLVYRGMLPKGFVPQGIVAQGLVAQGLCCPIQVHWVLVLYLIG